MSEQIELIDAIVSRLMVDDWKSEISYENYFNVCRPLSCTYESNEKSNWIEVITSIISVYGGASLILGFTVLLFVKFIRRLRRRVLPVETGESELVIFLLLYPCPRSSNHLF